LQQKYQAWLDNLPASLEESAIAERLREITSVDLSELEAVERGWGRD
jgi:hypothetical protein